MFKIKTNNPEFKKQIEETYQIYSQQNYDYVICDETDLCEEDKINLCFSLSKVNDAKAIISAIIKSREVSLNLKSTEGIKKVRVNDIEYFESLENEVYAVCGRSRYVCDEKLYTLEEMLKDMHFVRTSKSFLVNILKINIIRPMLNYKFLLIMTNGDKIDVNRTYVKSFKQKLNL